MEVAVSFILINYQTADLTSACIRSIQQYTTGLSCEIIVVDNQSSDGSAEILAAISGIRLIRSPKNLGFGQGNNLGASHASGKYLFFLNTDTYLLNNAASLFYNYMEQHPNAGCCGGDLLSPSGQKQVAYGHFPTLLEAFSQLGVYKLYPAYYTEKLALAVPNHRSEIHEVDYISGADLFIRSSLFSELNGFDPRFFLYFEETELCWRIRKNGYISVLLPDAKIVHLEGGSQTQGATYNDQRQAQFVTSRYIYFKKTRGNLVACIAQILYAIQALFLWALKRDGHYLKLFRIIVRSS